MELEQALAIVKAAGYRVTKPKEKAHNGNHGLNVLGLPFGAGYSPNYKMKYRTPLVSIAGMGGRIPWVPCDRDGSPLQNKELTPI